MNAEVTPVEGCRSKLHVEIPAAEVAAARKKILYSYQRHAELPGYRKGKAPLPALERRFGDRIAQDLSDELTRTGWQDASKEKGLQVVAIVNVENVAIGVDGFSADYTFDAPPEFELPAYDSIPVRYEKVAVSDADVDHQFEDLRRAAATLTDADADHVIADGDLVQASIAGSADGGPIDELVGEEHKTLAANDAAWARAGAEYGAIPGLGKAVVGKKSGEAFEFDTVFADDFYVEALRGKSVHYAGTVGKVSAFVPAEVNEDFCKRFGAANADELRVAIRGRLEEQAAEANEQRLTEAICQYLLANTSFEPPKSSVDSETRSLVQEMVAGGMSRGADKDAIAKDKDKILETAERLAVDRVRVSWILRRIAEAEKIESTQGELRARIQQIAARRESTYDKVYDELSRRGALEDIKGAILRDKAVAWLREHVKEA